MSELVVTLTRNDVTMPDAVEAFLACKDPPVKYRGLKSHGMESNKMKEPTQCMKDNGKITFLKVVSYTEAERMHGAKLVVECGSDYLVGTIFYDSVFEYIRATGLKYCPFVDTVTQNPSILQGTMRGMLNQEAMFAEKGCVGIDPLGHRYVDGDPAALPIKYIVKAKKPAILAGSIGSDERVAEVLGMDPWMFIMGSALFAKEFAEDGNFRQNLEYILGLLK